MYKLVIKISKKDEIQYEGEKETILMITKSATEQFENNDEYINFGYAVIKKIIRIFLYGQIKVGDYIGVNKIYYIYEWIRLDTNEPFYVGKGKGNR